MVLLIILHFFSATVRFTSGVLNKMPQQSLSGLSFGADIQSTI